MATFQIDVVVNTRGAEQGVDRVDRGLSRIEQSIRRIGQLLTVAFGFQAFAGAIRSIGQFADVLTNAQNRVRSLGIDGEALNSTMSTLFGIANRTRQSFSTTTEVFARTAASLRTLGIGADEAARLTESLNQAVALSGSTTAEASNALIQFSQGLASGTLRGDELRSVLEQIPVVADVIAKQLGVTRNELRDLAATGAITGDVIVEAFRNAREELAERFAALVPTIGQAFVVLQNRVQEVAGTFLQTSGASEALARSLLFAADNIEVLLRSAVALATTLTTLVAGRAIPAVIAGLRALAVAALANPFTTLAVAISSLIGVFVAFGDQLAFTNDGLVSFRDVAIAAFNALVAAVAPAFNAIGSLINQFIPNVSLIGVSVEDSARVVARGLDIIIAGFAGMVAGVRAAVGNLGPVLQDAFISSLNGIIGTVENFINTVIRVFADLGGLLARAAGNALLGLARIFSTGFSDIVSFVADIPRRIADALGGLFTTGVDAGASLIDGITSSIDSELNLQTGLVEVSLRRLENPAAGALSDVGLAAGQAFGDALSQAPATAALNAVLADARASAVPEAAEVGTEIGETLGESAAAATIRAQAALRDALQGLLGPVSEFLGLSQQEFENFSANVSTILGGLDLGGALSAGLDGIATLIGTTSADLANAFGGVFAILNELGFSIEDVFGERGAQAVRILGVVTSEQFQGILNVGRDVFTRVFNLVSGLVPAFGGASAAAGTFGTTATTAGTSATVALGPLALLLAAITGAVLLLIAVFGGFGEEARKVGLILAVVFAPAIATTFVLVEAIRFLIDIFTSLADTGNTVGLVLSVAFAPVVIPILLIIEAVEFLIDLFSGLGSAGSTVGTVLAIAFAPIILPILAIIEAVEFLIDLFSGLGSAGSTVGTVLAVAFAPIILPILAIIEAVEFLIDLFSGLGSAGGIAGTLLQVALAPIVIPIRLIIEAVQFLIDLFSGLGSAGSIASTILQVALAPIVLPILAIIEAVQFLIGAFGSLGDAAGFLGGVVTDVFNGILSVGQTVFNGLVSVAQGAFNIISGAAQAAFSFIQQAGQALFNVLTGVINGFVSFFQGAFNVLQNVASTAWNIIQSVGQAAFSALSSVVQGFLGVFTGVFNQILGVGRSVFNGILSIGNSVFSALGGFARGFGSVFSGVFNGIVGVARGVFNSILSIGQSAFNGLISAASSAASAIGGVFSGIISGAQSAAAQVGNIIGGAGSIVGDVGSSIIGGAKSAVKKTGKKAKKVIKKLFADGGVIDGPVGLAGPGVAGKAFRTGGIFQAPTALTNAQNATQTKNLGLAGEAGPEGLLPLAKIGGGLGVRTVFDPKIMRSIEESVERGIQDNRPEGSGTTIINKKVIVISAPNENIDDLRDRVDGMDAEFESRVGSAVVEIFEEAIAS